MTSLPLYLDSAQNTAPAIRARVLAAFAAVAPGLPTNQGDFPYDLTEPAVLELAQVALALSVWLDRGFAQTAFGEYLDRKVADLGVERIQATPATVTLRFAGADGTVVPALTRASTAASGIVQPVIFETQAAGTVAGGSVDVTALALTAGALGNVGPGTVIYLPTPIAGITSVTNPAAATGGVDTEIDAVLLARYLQKARTPSAGGNRGDYINWALAVPGVGGVNVAFPAEGSPAVPNGSVRLSLIGTNKAPAALSVLDAVLTAILDPRRVGPIEAETLTLSGFGASVDATQSDDVGNSVKFVYSASGNGQATRATLQTLLSQPGVHMVKAKAKVSSAAGSTAFFRLQVYNVSAAAVAKISPSSSTDAQTDYRANQLATTFPDATYDFGWLSQDFYWNGTDVLELRIFRLVADTTTQVWLDQVRIRSAGANDASLLTKSPGGHRVEVQAATTVPITVVATLAYSAGYDPAAVRAAAEARLVAYMNGIALQTNNDVQYARVGNELLETPGVANVVSWTVNGGTANISISSEQVATLVQPASLT